MNRSTHLGWLIYLGLGVYCLLAGAPGWLAIAYALGALYAAL